MSDEKTTWDIEERYIDEGEPQRCVTSGFEQLSFAVAVLKGWMQRNPHREFHLIEVTTTSVRKEVSVEAALAKAEGKG